MLIKTALTASIVFIAIGYIQLVKSDFSDFLAAEDHRSYYFNLVMDNVFSTCSNKNLFASLLFITIPFALYTLISNHETRKSAIVWRTISAITIVANATLIVLLMSRTVFASIFLTLMAFAAISYIYIFRISPEKHGTKVSPKAKKICIVAPVVVVLAAIIFVQSTDTILENTIKERIGLTFNPEKYGYRDNEHGESSTAMRTIIWSKTIEMVKDRPIVGHGIGQWQIIVPKYGVNEFGEKLRNGNQTFQRPHNDYLWFASELGLIGLIGYLIFYIGIIYICICNIKESNDKNTIVFNILAVSALIGWMVVYNLDFSHERIEHNIMYLSIAAIALSDYHAARSKDDKCASKAGSILILAVCAGISIIGTYQSYQYYKGESNGRLILERHYAHKWDQVIQLTNDIHSQPYTLNNFTTPMPYYRGVAFSMKGDQESAIKEFDKCMQIHPYCILNFCSKGIALIKSGKYDEALDCLSNALAMSPRCTDALYNTAICHFNKKDINNAFLYINKIPFDVKDKSASFYETYLMIYKKMALEKKDIYNRDNLVSWINDDKKVANTIKKYQKENRSDLSELLLEELGSSN